MHVKSRQELRRLFEYRPDGVLLWITPPRGKRYGQIAGGRVEPSGYRFVWIDGKKFRLHRVIYAWHYNKWPKEIDHSDRKKDNNRIGNLRPATHSLNCSNRDKPKSNTTGHKNVFRSWIGGYYVQKRRKHFGRYKTLGEAAAVAAGLP